MNSMPTAPHTHSILIVKIAQYKPYLIEAIVNASHEHHIKEEDQEDLFDYCIAKTLDSVLRLRVRGRVLLAPDHDLYRIVYSSVQYVFQKCIQNTLYGYGITLHPGERVKIISTYDEIILVRYY